MRLRGRFIARKTSNPDLTMIFGYAKDFKTNLDTTHDIVFAADLEGYTEEVISTSTWNQSPEDILEDGIPPLRRKTND